MTTISHDVDSSKIIERSTGTLQTSIIIVFFGSLNVLRINSNVYNYFVLQLVVLQMSFLHKRLTKILFGTGIV